MNNSQQLVSLALEPELIEVLFEATNIAADAFLITDPKQNDNPIIFVSDSFCQLTGYSRQDILRKNCRFLQGKDSDRSEVTKMYEAIKQEKPYQGILLNYRKDGSSFWNWVRIIPIFNQQKQLRFFTGVQTDITELKQAQQCILQQQQEIAHMNRLQIVEEISSSIFHEIRQPLSAINNYADASLLYKQDEQAYIESLSKIKQQTQRIEQLIQTMTHFSKRQVRNNKNSICDINKVANDAIQLLYPELINFQLTTLFSQKTLNVNANETLLLQVFLNILQNALEAVKERYPPYEDLREKHGRIALTTKKNKQQAVIQIENNGIIISEEQKTKMFQAFYTSKTAGIGIGLTIVQRIITSFAGQITVEQNAKQDTCFTITLPLPTDAMHDEK